MTGLYETQRAMRHMRRAAMQRGVVAVLDVGTSKIACLILRFDGPERLREADGVGPMAGQSSFRVIGAATTRSRGVKFGEIAPVVTPRPICIGFELEPPTFWLTRSMNWTELALNATVLMFARLLPITLSFC